MEPVSGVFVLKEKVKFGPFGWFTRYVTIYKIIADDINTFLHAVESVPGTVILDSDNDSLIKENPLPGEETE